MFPYFFRRKGMTVLKKSRKMWLEYMWSLESKQEKWLVEKSYVFTIFILTTKILMGGDMMILLQKKKNLAVVWRGRECW